VNILEGKTALVIGASGGIGRASSQALARAGAGIVVADLDNNAAATANDIVGSGGEAMAASIDVRDEDQIRRVVAETISRFGRLDVLHYNAAAVSPEQRRRDGDVTHLDIETWDEAMNVNVRGAMLAAKHAIPEMIRTGGGSIIFSGSGRGQRADLHSTAYGVSKAALHHLARYIATQYGKQGVRCNAMAIGVVLTESAISGLPTAQLEDLASKHLTPKLGAPQDIADATVFLASDASRFITGTVIDVDGGFGAHIGVTRRA
jgi:NAD(P)-dependent dehydrogenase (short-subunit alcohol dehydrogenase family)